MVYVWAWGGRWRGEVTKVLAVFPLADRNQGGKSQQYGHNKTFNGYIKGFWTGKEGEHPRTLPRGKHGLPASAMCILSTVSKVHDDIVSDVIMHS